MGCGATGCRTATIANPLPPFAEVPCSEGMRHHGALEAAVTAAAGEPGVEPWPPCGQSSLRLSRYALSRMRLPDDRRNA